MKSSTIAPLLFLVLVSCVGCNKLPSNLTEVKEDLTEAQLRNKRSTAIDINNSIRTPYKKYYVENGKGLALRRCPKGEPSSKKLTFDEECIAAWSELDWQPPPDGVHCRYSATTSSDNFEIKCECDMDDDGQYAVIKATNTTKSELVTNNAFF